MILNHQWKVIFPIVALKFGSRPKVYSDKYCQIYLKLQEASLNQINILDYYLKSCYLDEYFIYNEKEIDFSVFDKSTSNLPALYNSGACSKILNLIVNY